MVSDSDRQDKTAVFLLFFFMLITCAMTTYLGWQRYEGFNVASFDLGTISQAMWTSTQGQPLVHTRWGVPFSRLAEHVEVFYLLIVPLYAVWSSPKLLVLIQSVLFVAGAWPLYQLALRRLGASHWAVMIALAYLLYPVGLTAVLFEFHGDTLAMPLLLFALNSLDKENYRAYWMWVALALSCKFYVAIPVFVLGGVWFIEEELNLSRLVTLAREVLVSRNLSSLSSKQKIGLWTMGMAAMWGAIAFFGIRSTLAPVEEVTKTTVDGYFSYYFGTFSALQADWVSRASTALLIYAPVLFLGIRAPLWLLVASSTALPALISTGPGPAYSYRFHHYALAVPFLLMAVIAGANKVDRGRIQLGLRSLVVMVVLFGFLLPDFPYSPLFYRMPLGSGYGADVTGYATTDRDAFKAQWLAEHVPDQAPVMADKLSAIRLVNRPLLYLTNPEFSTLDDALQDADVVVIDALYDLPVSDGVTLFEDGIDKEYDVIRRFLDHELFGLEAMGDGVMLFTRSAEDRLPYTLQQMPLSAPPQGLPLSDGLWLKESSAIPISTEQIELTFQFYTTNPITTPLVIVSQLENFPQTRVVHFPLFDVAWSSDTLIEETLTVDWPLDGAVDVGMRWQTAVYDPTSPYALFTDERSQLSNPIYTEVEP